MDSNQIFIDEINKLDASAFRLLYRTYYRALVCYAIQIVGEADAAEDIVQELFSIMWEKKMTFQSLLSFKAYLYNSVRNASFDYLKHKDVENSYLQRIVDTHQAYGAEEDDDDEFFSEEVYRQLLQTITELPERCQAVFLLYMEGQKNEEIAAALSVSLETVKTQKKRAMAFLRKKLYPNQYLRMLLLFA